MLWLKIKNNFILCVRSVTILDKIRGQVSTFDIKLVSLIHMRKAWGVRREMLFLTLYSLLFTLYDLFLTLYSVRLFLLKLLLFWRTYLSFLNSFVIRRISPNNFNYKWIYTQPGTVPLINLRMWFFGNHICHIEGNKIFFFLTNLRFFKSTRRSAVKAVSPKGAKWNEAALTASEAAC